MAEKASVEKIISLSRRAFLATAAAGLGALATAQSYARADRHRPHRSVDASAVRQRRDPAGIRSRGSQTSTARP